jgi:APA family basic amino acid/polyamine antiporter
MRLAFGSRGASLIAVGIAISTLGFLSQGMLTAPRVYFAMAGDGLFFKSIAWVDPRSRVPVPAIALQGALAIVIALSGRYEQILNYVVSVDFIWFGLTAATIFVFRHRAALEGERLRSDDRGGETSARLSAAEIAEQAKRYRAGGDYRVPGHPVTTLLFVAACALIVISTIYKYPANSAIGLMIVVAGIPVYFFWRWWRTK